MCVHDIYVSKRKISFWTNFWSQRKIILIYHFISNLLSIATNLRMVFNYYHFIQEYLIYLKYFYAVFTMMEESYEFCTSFREKNAKTSE